MADNNPKRNTNKTKGTVATILGAILLLLALYSLVAVLSKPIMGFGSMGISYIVGLFLLLWGLRRLEVTRLEIAAIGIVILIFSFGLFIFLVFLSVAITEGA
jgi:uncharacterized membrane protein